MWTYSRGTTASGPDCPGCLRRTARFRRALRRRLLLLRRALVPRTRARPRTVVPDAGMTTIEYAVGTLAACAFAMVLVKVVKSDVVSSRMQGLIERALDAAV